MNHYYIPWREGYEPERLIGAISAHRKFKEVVRPRMVYQFGWSNQPKVLAFSSRFDADYMRTYVQPTLDALGPWCPNITEKDF